MRLKGLLQPLKESDKFVQVINSIKNNRPLRMVILRLISRSIVSNEKIH